MKFIKLLLIAGLIVGAFATASWASSSQGGRLQGTLQAVDTTNATITVNGQTFTVSPNAVIEVRQGTSEMHISFAQLPNYIGKTVEINFDAHGRVHKIEVKL